LSAPGGCSTATGSARGVDLVVEDGVVRIGSRSGPFDRVVEAAYAVPGLVDTHVHLPYDGRPGVFYDSVANVIRLFRMHGVLGVRDCDNFLENISLFRSVDPGFHIDCSYAVEKPPLHWPHMRPVDSAGDVAGEVEKARVEGCRWLKLYVNVDEDLAREAVARAHGKGLRVTGHVDGIGVLKAIELGFDCIEHIDSIAKLRPGAGLLESWEAVDEGTLEEIARRLAQRGTAVVPTLSIYRAAAGKLRVDKKKYSKLVSP